MGKKAKKAKVAKKPAKAAKKKSAPKKAAKKLARKKVVAKKTAKKKTVKKVFAKKKAKKAVVKKLSKKKVAAKKKSVKKAIAQKLVKKVSAKKYITKTEAKKSEQKKDTSTKIKITAIEPVVKAPLLVETKIKEEPVKSAKTKKEEALLDEENAGTEELNFQYEIPETFIKPRSRFPQPKPFIPKKEDKRARYSEKELSEFRTIIVEKLDEAKKDYELLKATLTHKDEHGTDDTSPTFKLLEDGSDVLSKEETAQLAGRQEKFIQNLQNALMRIENKTYGICRATGKLIPKERLRSVPHATLSIGAKLEGTY